MKTTDGNEILTKQPENFSFSEQPSEIRDDEEIVSIKISQLKYNNKKHLDKYFDSITRNAYALKFSGHINGSHL